ncbi:unnamed protein product, partial [Rotaria sordida]
NEASIVNYWPIDEDSCRYLLTDYFGKLYLFVLKRRDVIISETRVSTFLVIDISLKHEDFNEFGATR